MVFGQQTQTATDVNDGHLVVTFAIKVTYHAHLQDYLYSGAQLEYIS